MPSRGKPAERKAARKYGLELDESQDSLADAWDASRPVQVKSCRRVHADGRKGTFHFYRGDAVYLADRRGYFVLVLYPPGSDTRASRIKKISTSRLESVMRANGLKWGPSGHRSKGKQVKVRYDLLIS